LLLGTYRWYDNYAVVRWYFPFHGNAVVNVLVYVVGIARVALDSSSLRHLCDFPFTTFFQAYHVGSLKTGGPRES